MSFVSGLAGLAGGSSGTGFATPTLAETTNPTTADQASTSYGQTQSGIANQQAFAKQLQAQNGAGNQSAVFNQLQGVASGTGPNPAQAQLAQSTGTNISNQAALMAGQRGSSQNAGMIARQAAMQGANTQQQAAGQAATLQANQSLNALNSMGSIANQQVTNSANANNSYSSAALSQQQNLLNGISAQNNAAVANQGNVNTNNAALAGGKASGQSGLLGGLTGALGPAASMFGGSGGGAAGSAGDLGAIGAGTSEAGGAADAVGGAGEIVGDGTMLAANGGMVPHMKRYADGGQVDSTQQMIDPSQPMQQTQMSADPSLPMTTPASDMAASGPQSFYGKVLNQGVSTQGPQDTTPAVADRKITGGAGNISSDPNVLDANEQQHATTSGTGETAVINGNSRDEAWNWEGTAKGAGQGAEIGSTVGSFFPVIGNAIGAVVGGVVGGVGGGIPSGKRKANAKGGMTNKDGTDALVSPGEKYLSPEAVQQVLHGKDAMQIGKTIPGKPNVSGAKNSYANDTVPAKLDPGGIVIPRSITQGKHPGFAAKKFVEMTLAKNSLPKKGGK